MRPGLRRLVRPLAAALVVGFAGLYLARNAEAFVAAATSLSAEALALAIGFAALYWVALAVAWWRLQGTLGGGLGFAAALRVWSLSTVARYVPGNVWHIAGRSALAKDAGGSPVAALTASAYEQALTLAGAFIAAGALLPISGGGPAYLLAMAALPIGLAALHPAVQRAVVQRAARLLGRSPPRVLNVRQLGGLLAVYILPNIPAGLALVALGWPEGPGPASAVGAFAFAWAVGFLSFFTPSGLGVREVVLGGLLAAGLSGADPALLAVGHRLVLTIAELAVAAVAAGSGRLAARVL
jgi:hypothetical protein